MDVTVRVEIHAPVERVFAAFTDFSKMEQRLSAVKKIEFLAQEGRPEVGMKWRETRIMFGKEATEEMWITEINQNRNYVIEAESHGTQYRSEYRFIDKGSSTEVVLTFAGRPVNWIASVGSLLSILFKSSIEKSLQADMEELKQVLETKEQTV